MPTCQQERFDDLQAESYTSHGCRGT